VGPEALSSFSPTVLAVVVVYLAANLVIGMWPSKQASASAAGFVAGDRGLGLVLMYFITGATIFSAFSFLGAPGWAYSRGAAVFYIFAYGVLGFVPFYFLGPRAARLGRIHGFVTQAEMVAHRFQMPALAGAMALVSTLALVPYLALQIKGAGIVLSAITGGGVSVALGGAIVYAVVLAYVLKSGVLGVGWTNVFQGVCMILLAWGLGLYLPHALYGGVEPMFRRIASERPELLVLPGLDKDGASWTWGMFASSVLVSTIGFSCWPQLFMKAFSAKDDRTLRRTVVLYPTFQLFQIPILLIGFAGVLFASAPSTPDQILPHMLLRMELPELAIGLFCAGALAAGMSTGDAISHAAASILVRDGWVTAFRKRLSPTGERAAIRAMLVVVMVGSYVLAVFHERTLVDLLLYAYGPITQFAPVLVATLYSRRATGQGVLAGLLTGVAVNVWLDLDPAAKPWPLHAGVYGLAANLAALMVVSALTRPRPDTREADLLWIPTGQPLSQ